MAWIRARSMLVLAATLLAASFCVAPPAQSAADPVHPRIVKGSTTTTGAFPWQAQLRIRDRYICGGTLISPTVVLTAAHCLADVDAPGQVEVFLGRDRSDAGGIAQPAVAFGVNPRYLAPRPRGDWGYVVLGTPARAPYVPIQIAGPDESSLWDTGSSATVSGYGKTSENGATYSRTLRKVQVHVLADRVCERRTSYGRGFDEAAMLCAGNPEAGKDACQGDSGGPLVARADDGSFRLVGIVSLGEGCARRDFPGIYTRIANPVVSSELVAQLAAQPATAGYAYVGAGGACLSATAEAARLAALVDSADRRTERATADRDRADARLARAQQRYRRHPTRVLRHGQESASAERRLAGQILRGERRRLARLRGRATTATGTATTACS